MIPVLLEETNVGATLPALDAVLLREGRGLLSSGSDGTTLVPEGKVPEDITLLSKGPDGITLVPEGKTPMAEGRIPVAEGITPVKDGSTPVDPMMPCEPVEVDDDGCTMDDGRTPVEAGPGDPEAVDDPEMMKGPRNDVESAAVDDRPVADGELAETIVDGSTPVAPPVPTTLDDEDLEGWLTTDERSDEMSVGRTTVEGSPRLVPIVGTTVVAMLVDEVRRDEVGCTMGEAMPPVDAMFETPEDWTLEG
ncbi:hypothetical protein CC80DRAFT_543955 [Byssothecium circinans]|uniref:Uncharacterized protein n=1 Tax=Byssothecium circinans TaxID=147558 RepID=A0A6A5U974_9PLEO|nr:hypothetical protein CC80DRAFT_543955 [Byssothecium circinans]